MRISLRGQALLLDHRRALFWPTQKSLFVADTHFGKSAVFRREGIALPEGSDRDDLAILDALIRDYRAEHLYILGDFMHGSLPDGHPVYRRFNDWRKRQRSTDIHVVLGNHDAFLDRRALDGVCWHHRLSLPPFELVHEPESARGEFYVAGHIHPVVRFSTRADSLRMPVFWQRDAGLVLPSFGATTGGHTIKPGRSERLFLVGPDAVTAFVPATATGN